MNHIPAKHEAIEAEVALHDGPAEPVRFHPYANLFPMLEGQPYWDLVADIRDHGVREPIVMLDGQILDGRNRYMAARKAGVPYPVIEYQGDDPLAYVVSLNLKRRHLTDSQRQMVGARLDKLPRGRPGENPPIGGIIPTEQAAEMLNTSVRGIERARAVVERGAPSLVASVEAGEVSVSAAAEVAKLPESQQVEIVDQGPSAVRQAAKEIRDKGADDASRAIREGLAEILSQPAPRHRPGRNPLYTGPNPLGDARNDLRASAEMLSDILARYGPDQLLGAYVDQAHRDRDLPVIRAGHDALSAFLEYVDAQ